MNKKEALEIVRKNYPHVGFSGSEFETALRELVPELKESENERIRKALVKTFEKKLEIGFEWTEFGIPNRSVLDWLERQKEQKPAEEWNEEDEINKDLAIGKLEGTEVDLDYDVTQQVISWLKWLPNRYVPGGKCTICIEHSRGYQEGLKAGREELKQEWSEEDEKALNRAINICKNDFGENSETASFLKSLPERFNLQPKQEWSAQDRIYRRLY